MQYKFSNGKFVLDEKGVFSSLERIRELVNHCETLLKYTKKTVKRKKIMHELNWWEDQLVMHEEAVRKIEDGKIRDYDIECNFDVS